MLLHEKMRLQRKISKLTAKQALASSRKERVTKQIEKVQKMYSKKESYLENEAKRLQNNARMAFRGMLGLGMNDFNPYSYQQGSAGTSAAVWNLMQQGLQQEGIDTQLAQDFLFKGRYRQGATQDGQPTFYDLSQKEGDGYQTVDSDTAEKLQKIAQIQNWANMGVTQAQSQCSAMTSQYENNVSIWLEAAKEQLEAEQDEALMPLQDQELEWDLESQSAETQLADARARLDSIKQALSDGIKDSAPTFGLG